MIWDTVPNFDNASMSGGSRWTGECTSSCCFGNDDSGVWEVEEDEEGDDNCTTVIRHPTSILFQ